MKGAFVRGYKDESLQVTIRNVPIPVPGAKQLLIKVIASGTNPKDWKGPVRIPAQNNTNTGDDIAGIVQSVGSSVHEFKPGDRVASLHKLKTPHGSYAEYALGEDHSTFFLPPHVSFEDGATIPLAAMTATIGLFCSFGLPEPWSQDKALRDGTNGGVVVYGAASAVGAFAIKLLRKSDIHPIIAIAGKGIQFVEGLIDREKGDGIVDYRNGNDAVVEGIRKSVTPGKKLMYAFDAVSEHGSYLNIAKVLESNGNLTTVTPGHKDEGLPENVNLRLTNVTTSQTDHKLFATAWFRLFYHGLQDGWFSGHTYQVVSGGLDGIQNGLESLKDGKASGFKYVYRIGETSDVDKTQQTRESGS